MEIIQLNNSQISIKWSSVPNAVSYKVFVTGLGAKDTNKYETRTNDTNFTQSNLVVGSYYRVLVQWQDASGNLTDVEPSFLCRVGNGGTGVIVCDLVGVEFYESITSGTFTVSGTINADGCLLVNLPAFLAQDLQYVAVYRLGSPYAENQYGSHFFPITTDTMLAISIANSDMTGPNDNITITLYPFKG